MAQQLVKLMRDIPDYKTVDLQLVWVEQAATQFFLEKNYFAGDKN